MKVKWNEEQEWMCLAQGRSRMLASFPGLNDPSPQMGPCSPEPRWPLDTSLGVYMEQTWYRVNKRRLGLGASLSVCLSFSLSLSLYLYMFLCISVSVSVSVSVFPSGCLFLSVSLSPSLSVSVSVSLSHKHKQHTHTLSTINASLFISKVHTWSHWV